MGGWWRDMSWMNPPASAIGVGAHLAVETGEKGDFWRETFYDFVHDNGHALLTPAPVEFTASLRFSAQYQAQYDQAGLMLRAAPDVWVKCGIEYVGGRTYLAAVVTHGRSDWSQMLLDLTDNTLDLRLSRARDAIWVQYRQPDGWKMFRLAYFPPGISAEVGPMCCSPSRAGLRVDFHDFTLGPLAADKAY
jgi:uncharacterized protein